MVAQGSFYAGRRVWVAGHSETVGAAVVRRLWREPCEIVLASRSQLDLGRQAEVEAWMRRHRPHVVFLVADRRPGRGRGSEARARAMQETLAATLHVLEAALQAGAETVVNLTGVRSPAVEPPQAAADPPEEALLAWSSDAVAQLAAIRLTLGYARRSATRFIAPAPLCVYSPDEADPLGAAAIGPLLERIAAAAARGEPRLTLDAGALARRGLIHVDDLADAAVFAAAFAGDGLIRLAPGGAPGALALLKMIAEAVGYRGEVELLAAPPNGQQPPSFLAAALGWRPSLDPAAVARQIHTSWIKRGEARRGFRPL